MRLHQSVLLNSHCLVQLLTSNTSLKKYGLIFNSFKYGLIFYSFKSLLVKSDTFLFHCCSLAWIFNTHDSKWKILVFLRLKYSLANSRNTKVISWTMIFLFLNHMFVFCKLLCLCFLSPLLNFISFVFSPSTTHFCSYSHMHVAFRSLTCLFAFIGSQTYTLLWSASKMHQGI